MNEMTALYEMIFKRKSFHLFRGVGNDRISKSELDEIEKAVDSFERLYQEIKTAIRFGIMSPHAALYFNRIDVGIYLCIPEICMQKSGIKYTRKLFVDNADDVELTKSAEYRI